MMAMRAQCDPNACALQFDELHCWYNDAHDVVDAAFRFASAAEPDNDQTAFQVCDCHARGRVVRGQKVQGDVDSMEKLQAEADEDVGLGGRNQRGTPPATPEAAAMSSVLLGAMRSAPLPRLRGKTRAQRKLLIARLPLWTLRPMATVTWARARSLEGSLLPIAKVSLPLR